jgi:hypothetical protein
MAAGSGLYQPASFDSFRDWSGTPAALFALPVVRRPGPGVVTVLGSSPLISTSQKQNSNSWIVGTAAKYSIVLG